MNMSQTNDSNKNNNINTSQYVQWFRSCAPYIHSHRGRTFIISLAGETIEHENFAHIIHDIALLNSLGIKLILVHGARPQIARQLEALNIATEFKDGWRITDKKTLPAIKQAVGQVRLNIESRLSMGLINTPMSGASLNVVSGNFVVAQPYGIHQGVDFAHTGKVRRINTQAIQQQLELNNIVLLSPIGYSTTGEAFNCRAEDIATQTATALGADKLIFFMDAEGVKDENKQLIHQLNVLQAEKTLLNNANNNITKLHISSALQACKHGVKRSHLISHHHDGALLQELYTRDGEGTLITIETYEDTRRASINDVGGILELIQPLEQKGILAHRSREQLELEIESFSVIERDGMMIACAALFPYADDIAELACVAVHEDYRKQGRAQMLLQHIEQQCSIKNIKQLFLLTTHTAHWFQEQGFIETDLNTLPVERQKLYNNQRNSKMFCKAL